MNGSPVGQIIKININFLINCVLFSSTPLKLEEKRLMEILDKHRRVKEQIRFSPSSAVGLVM